VSKQPSFCHCIANNALDRGLMARRRFPVAKIEDSSSSGVDSVVLLVFALHDSPFAPLNHRMSQSYSIIGRLHSSQFS
jgi:hypothetical protein